MRPSIAAMLAPLALAASACAGESWMTAPAGSQSAGIARLAWIFGGVAIVVWLSVLGFVLWAVLAGRRRAAPATDAETSRRQRRGVVVAAGASLAALLALALVDFVGLRTLEERSMEGDPLVIEVTGHQWWWEVSYEPDDPRRRFETANELHIPVGRPVLLRLRSADVIHSFWVPRLQGKRDLVPGYQNALWIQADEPGVYRGSCAEFCGVQHAKMQLLVVAEPPEAFETWRAAQLRPAVQPVEPLALRGRDVFVEHRCALCHAVRGTPARGQVAPDLTHLASRLTLAAGVLPNTRGHLGGWIVDPQQVKRGVRMPSNPLPGDQLQALLRYLETLR